MKYPIPVYHFRVNMGGESAEFSEVSGLTMERQAISYRHGLLKDAPDIKMPGIAKFGDIVLKRGMTQGNNEFVEWLNKALLNKADKRDVTIILLNEEGAPTVTWTVAEAFPIKVEGPGIKATGNEVAIEAITLAHSGFTVEVG